VEDAKRAAAAQAAENARKAASAGSNGKPHPVAVARPEELDVKLHAKYFAQVTVDPGTANQRDLGSDNIFSLKLTAGAHRVLVHHQCCLDATQELLFTRNRPNQIYQLTYGTPMPAQFKVMNAPPDARVLIDGVLVGTASDLRPYTMAHPDEKATVTIGDRRLVTTLKAGVLNPLDYAKASP
jgi:hypothetical protein